MLALSSMVRRPFVIFNRLPRALLSFNAAIETVTRLAKEPSSEDKLKLYALYKQATVGRNTSKKPGMLDIVSKYKWEAWSALGDMPKEEAEKNYVSLVKKLQSNEEAKPKSNPGEDNSIEGLTVTFNDGILKFRLNNPRRKNPVSIEMYQSIANQLRNGADDPTCRVAVITGTGDYYSSGNDFKNFQKTMSLAKANSSGNLLEASAELGRIVISDFQEALIEFPKPLIALVNGPAVGVMVTTLCLCDAVLASEKATFSTPFAKLAFSPEGCSTLTFPLTMGPLVANDMLLFGRILNANEAKNYGLVSRVFDANSFESECDNFVKLAASLPPKSFQASKMLIRGSKGQPLSRETLLSVSREECKVLAKQWQSEECIAAVNNFLSRK